MILYLELAIRGRNLEREKKRKKEREKESEREREKEREQGSKREYYKSNVISLIIYSRCLVYFNIIYFSRSFILILSR